MTHSQLTFVNFGLSNLHIVYCRHTLRPTYHK